MSANSKSILVAIGAVAVIVASCSWIFFTQMKESRYDVAMQVKIGEVLAEQTAKASGNKGKIVALTISAKDWPELGTQMSAFKKKLKTLGTFDLREYELDTKDQPKYGAGSGLSGRRYVRTVKKNPKADLFVSFVGAPKVTEEEARELEKKPKFIVESRSADNLIDLFEKHLLDAAVVSRFQFPAPGPQNPRTTDEWFVKRFQIVTGPLATESASAE